MKQKNTILKTNKLKQTLSIFNLNNYSFDLIKTNENLKFKRQYQNNLNLSSLASNKLTEGASTTSLGKPFHMSTTIVCSPQFFKLITVTTERIR